MSLPMLPARHSNVRLALIRLGSLVHRSIGEQRKITKIICLVLFTIILLWYRRPDQFSHPYIWDEDGTVNLNSFVEHGLWSVFYPVNDYFILTTKLIALSAFKLSILWAPEISTVLVIVLTCGVVVSIGLAPTHLRWKPLCAIIPLLIPTDSEVFAVSEYAFWWAGIWLLLALLWDERRGGLSIRIIFIVIGGLSSPIILPLSLLFVVRAMADRRKTEWVCAAIALLIAAIQATALYASGHVEHLATRFSLPLFIYKFFGLFAALNLDPHEGGITIGWLLLSLIVITALFIYKKLDLYFYLLIISFVMICFITVQRQPISDIHPFLGGPRYFFYSYIQISWIIIWISVLSRRFLSVVLLAALTISVAQAIPKIPRRQDFVDWRKSIAACAKSKDYNVPIQFDGNLDTLWFIQLTGAQCQRLIDNSLL